MIHSCAVGTCLECLNLSRREQRGHLLASFHSTLARNRWRLSLSERKLKKAAERCSRGGRIEGGSANNVVDLPIAATVSAHTHESLTDIQTLCDDAAYDWAPPDRVDNIQSSRRELKSAARASARYRARVKAKTIPPEHHRHSATVLHPGASLDVTFKHLPSAH